jgi:predicted transcriptional regulator
MDATSLKVQIDNLYKDLKDARVTEEITQKYIDLSKNYPKLYTKILEDPLNEENKSRVYKMVLYITQIERGQHTQHSASVQVGEELAQKYIGDLLHNKK